MFFFSLHNRDFALTAKLSYDSAVTHLAQYNEQPSREGRVITCSHYALAPNDATELARHCLIASLSSSMWRFLPDAQVDLPRWRSAIFCRRLSSNILRNLVLRRIIIKKCMNKTHNVCFQSIWTKFVDLYIIFAIKLKYYILYYILYLYNIHHLYITSLSKTIQ